MAKQITIVGASVGGLVAAAELRLHGHNVTIIEKGKSVGGLYNKVDTPFGTKELGMHVLYVDDNHYRHLCEIFGEEVFNVMKGTDVDLGACANFGKISFNSPYPNAFCRPDAGVILGEMTHNSKISQPCENALDEAVRRFGITAGQNLVGPIMEKLWFTEPSMLTRHALHCFFDLRRIVVCDKPLADQLKNDPWLDDVIANPIQTEPKGKVFGGRMGLTFKAGYHDLAERANAWASRTGVAVEFGKKISVKDGCLLLNGAPLDATCDACIIAVPMHSLANEVIDQADTLELSIFYIQLSEKIGAQFPAYYLLCHDSGLRSSRIVNYDAYNSESMAESASVLAVEAIHQVGASPTEAEITTEVLKLFPTFDVKQSFKLAQSVKICSPTLKNSMLLTSVSNRIAAHFDSKPVYFTGMRTDTGIFFSHHTIGLAYESALECNRQLL